MRLRQLGLHRALLLRVSSLGLQFGIALLLSRVYGAFAYGMYAYFFSWVQVLSMLATLGLDWFLVRETAFRRASGSLDGLPSLIWNAHKYVALASLGSGIFLYIVQKILDSEMSSVLYLVALALPAATWLRLQQGALQGLGYPVSSQIPFYIGLPGLFALSLLIIDFFQWTWTPKMLLNINIIIFWLLLLLTTVWLWREVRVFPDARQGMPSGWLASSLRLLTSNGLSMLAHQLPIILAGSWFGSVASGIADLLVRGSLVIALPLSAVNLPLAPFLASTVKDPDQTRVQRTLTRATRTVFGIALILAVGYSGLGPQLLSWLNPAYRAVRFWWLVVLAIAQLVNVGVGPVVLILNMRGYERETLKGLLLGLILMAFLSLVLRSWALGGIFAAYAWGLMVWNGFLTFRVYKLLRLFPALWRPNLPTRSSS